MSWLFCCGDEKQKVYDKTQTMDLSRPIMPELKEQINQEDELEGLSGKQNAQSQLLNDILTKKSQIPQKEKRGYQAQ